MASKENNVWKKLLLCASRKYPRVRIFRNNVGSGWTGPGITLKPGQTYKAKGGERVLTVPRHIDFGLCEGSGDGIGFHSMLVTPEMVGRHIAVFTSMEAKADGKASKAQIEWCKLVNEAGGIAIIVNDPDQLNLELPL